MTTLKSLLLAPMALAASTLPTLAAPPAMPEKDCLAPAAFLTALDSAGDWVIKRAPDGAAEAELKGILFREAGMINVALFRNGCLAVVMVVGKAAPDVTA
jgi:hypothetical protein